MILRTIYYHQINSQKLYSKRRQTSFLTGISVSTNGFLLYSRLLLFQTAFTFHGEKRDSPSRLSFLIRYTASQPRNDGLLGRARVTSLSKTERIGSLKARYLMLWCRPLPTADGNYRPKKDGEKNVKRQSINEFRLKLASLRNYDWKWIIIGDRENGVCLHVYCQKSSSKPSPISVLFDLWIEDLFWFWFKSNHLQTRLKNIQANRRNQSVVFKSGQKMALRTFYFINVHKSCGTY